MAKNKIINVNLFGQEIGRIGLDETERRSSFQYHPDYISSTDLRNIFPKTGIIKQTSRVQLFGQFDNDTFKCLPPQFADSLPDLFGSIIFKAWLESRGATEISVLEQLAYVANRGMGAIEYSPSKRIPKNTTIHLDDIINVLHDVLDLKKSKSENYLNSKALINIFKIGTSAGGARPKILISEHKTTLEIIPGDVEHSDDYNHYLVKLAIDETMPYPREVVEFCYHQIAQKIGIRMMPSKLIDDKHFATLRFDRQDGKKIHTLTASGMTGWDFRDTKMSSYENLFKLASFLNIPHSQMVELFRRMVFNVVYKNTDDHMKNHSFIYDPEKDAWSLSPAYDLTFALNPLIDFKTTNQALSINGKRNNITRKDLLTIAEAFTIKNPAGIIEEVFAYRESLMALFEKHLIPKKVRENIYRKVSSKL